MAPVAFRWRYQTESGTPVKGPDETFEDKAEAEEWFADFWQELRAQGVDQVVLLDSQTEVYGPMSLHEE